jgi:hypothetical protein
MAVAVPIRPAVRDRRLDVLRGLCLLDMVLVHLLEQNVHTPFLINEAIMHWLRFAAGGFVMTSGLCIGAIHFQRALDPAKRLATYRSLLQRALFVLGVHYFASILTLILIPIHGQPVFDVGRMIWDVLTFHSGYDLLLFYVFMLAVSPLIIEALRRFGVTAVLAASVGIFFWRYDNPYLSLWAIENHFPLIRWQLIFVIGMALGSKLKTFDALPTRAKWHLLAGAISLALGIDILSAAERAGFFTLPWYLAVTKMPLSLLEVLRYLSLAVAAGVMLDRAWKWFGDSTAQRVLAAVGVQSLMLWVVHVPIVANVAPLPWPIAMVLAWALVWAAAVSGTWLTKQWNSHCTTLPRFSYVVPVIGSLLVSVTLLRLEQPRTTDIPLASADSVDESIFFSGDGSDLPIPVDDDSISDAA